MCVVLFGRSLQELFPPGCFYIFLKISPLPLSYPRGDGDGDRFPQKIYIPPRGELRGYSGTCRATGGAGRFGEVMGQNARVPMPAHFAPLGPFEFGVCARK